MIPPEFVQQLLSRLDIVEVVGAHVQLKKAGANLKGLCPFHGEKTPSFNVNPTRQTYHCFGCGAHGDALRFLMEHQGLGFIDAIKEMARRTGMEVPDDRRSEAEREQAQRQREQQKDLSELLGQAASYYRKELRESPRAIAYLKSRGLSGKIAAHFGLGYAPGGWRPLARCFPDYEDAQLEAAGLVLAREDKLDAQGQARRYDRFRDRIMFPIRNVTGAVIGFGGRVLDQGEPKYLNSPETPVFIKGQELYGLFEARTAIRRAGHALVVEGYMDVVALAQHGIGQAVATLGTACTAEHVAKLFRFTDQIVFSFDGDAAGRRAAARALQAALPHLSERRSVRFLFLPAEHDPDSYVREQGMAAFEACIAHAEPLSSYLLEVASADCRLDTPEGRAKFLAQARPLWAALPEGLLKRQLLGELARLGRLADAELLQTWAGHTAGAIAKSEPAGGSDEGQPRSAVRPRHGARSSKPRQQGLLKVLPPEDQLLRHLLLHAAEWEALSAEVHTRLIQRESAQAGMLAWLDRQIADHGALPWAQLRVLLQSDESAQALRESLPNLDLDQLDALATLEPEPGALDRLLMLVEQDSQTLSTLLGRPAIALRPRH